jgi:hypothetical protein
MAGHGPASSTVVARLQARVGHGLAVVLIGLAATGVAEAQNAYLVRSTDIINGPGSPMAFPAGITASFRSRHATRLYVEHGTQLTILDTASGATLLERPGIRASYPDRLAEILYEGTHAYIARSHPAGLFVTDVDLVTGGERHLTGPRGRHHVRHRPRRHQPTPGSSRRRNPNGDRVDRRRRLGGAGARGDPVAAARLGMRRPAGGQGRRA